MREFDTHVVRVLTIIAHFQVTLCKIGDKCVVDPSAEEESCSVISVIVGITGVPSCYCDKGDSEKETEGKFTTIDMSGPGSLAPKTLKNAISQGM